MDETATILMRASDGDSLRFLFQLPEPTPERPSLLPYIIPKGYIAIDGTSLTITSVDDAKRTFGVMLIQHTQQKVTLGRKSDGERVNIEVDMVGKYVEKSVLAALEGGGGEVLRSHIQRIVKDTLLNDGNSSFSATTNACV